MSMELELWTCRIAIREKGRRWRGRSRGRGGLPRVTVVAALGTMIQVQETDEGYEEAYHPYCGVELVGDGGY